MTSPFTAIGFGLVLISMAFLVLVFFRAWRDPHPELDRRYRVVSGALVIGAAGVSLWTLNPLMQAVGIGPLNGWLMLLASILMYISACMLIGSTILNGSRATVFWFVLTSLLWTFSVIFWEYGL